MLPRGPGFQSTRPVWGATKEPERSAPCLTISIHAPRMGRDLPIHAVRRGIWISIHAPRMGRDRPHKQRNRYGRISIHAPRMGRDAYVVVQSYRARISIHAPRMGRDYCRYLVKPPYHDFNPRAPYGARPRRGGEAMSTEAISIHAPRMGRDMDFSKRRPHRHANFNPRAPYGARPCLARPLALAMLFQSTRPVWGATSRCTAKTLSGFYFNPRAPYGARPHKIPKQARTCEFQSTRPVWGATCLC